MTSSPDAKVRLKPDTTDGAAGSGVSTTLPAALPSMWRLCKLGYRHEPRLMVAAFVLSQLAALPDALLALWLMLLGKGVLERRSGLVLTAAVGLGLSAAATWFLRTVGTRVQRRFRDKVTIALESHVARLQATVATIAHQERPDYLDLLDMLRNQVFVLDHMYMSVFSTCSWILRLVVTIALLMSIHPALILLAVFAIPTAFTATWRPGIERKVQERSAQSHRRARHLFTVATTAAPAKEVRIAGIGPSLMTERRLAWEHGYRPIAGVRWRSAMWHTMAWAVFGGAYVGAVVFVSSGLQAPASSVLLVLAAGARLSAYIGATVGEIGFLTGFWMYGARRLAWLEDYAAAMAASADLPVPGRISRGIRFDHVSFVYPGTDRLVLDDVNLMLPAGSVVAIVGENGAGKTTLVKLLAKMYEPRSGSNPHRRHAARASTGRPVAGAARGRVPGFLPLRIQGAPDGWRRRRAAPRRCAGGDGCGGAGRRRRSRRQAQGGTRHTARADVAERRGRLVRSVAEARARARLHAGWSAPARARRADRGARCRNRACALRAVRGRRTRRRAGPFGPAG